MLMYPVKQEKCRKCDFFIELNQAYEYKGFVFCSKCYPLISNGAMAVYVHDCENCKFLYTTDIIDDHSGYTHTIDMWYCNSVTHKASIVARFSNKPADCWSSLVSTVREIIKTKQIYLLDKDTVELKAATIAYHYLVKKGIIEK